ncbi:type II toxin-antitoxin system ParD family antitoxin [Agrobacterium sp. a22-2]|uniref:type II toxin-antitoxin system ParD family antitoxin n=1 Tax=Agrobacterium sp. a22-2 TaxID=2283840 RepID=UPI0014483FCD|nr:type II toxin-antitoxin system ParD family antitoxin [Agrobacterium sp. a22-2]NKN37986.1 type II toxin-antitoxin system ParD family antitoxin [Agrobacterium sp. a22-2]
MSNVRLNKKDGLFVEHLLEAGTYETAEDMVSAGLDLLREQENDTLRMLIQEGIDDIEAGRYHVYDSAEEMLADIRKSEKED